MGVYNEGFGTFYERLVRKEYLKSLNNKRGLIKSNFLNFPFQQNSFDLVWSPSFIDEVPNPKAYILEMKRVSKKYTLLFASNDIHPTHIHSKF